jgi:hypothetical protein
MYRNAHVYFLLALLVTLGGFGPTFYTRLGETRLPYLVHGVSATLWMVMLIAQSWIITHGGARWHRRLGWSSVVVFPALLLSGLYMVRLMLSVRMDDYGPLAYTLALIDVPSLILLGVFYALAIVHRLSVKLHSRYMAATVILLLPPSLGRFLVFWVPGIDSLPRALNPMMVLTELIALALVIDDRRGGKVHPPYPITLAFLLLIHALMWPVQEMAWFHGMASWLAGAG